MMVEQEALTDNGAGFSLVEMLVVLMLIGLVSGTVLWGLNILEKRQTARSLANSITAMLMSAHEQALYSKKQQVVIIELKAKRVSTDGAPKILQIPSTMSMSVTIGKEIVQDKERLEVIFLPDGTSSGIIIQLEDNRDKASLHTNWLTGLTRVDHDSN